MIVENVITRAPSAELRENQTDQDSLPPYDVLDAILERLVEREEPTASIVAAGFDRDTVMKVERMLYLAEYKRRQAAPGVKVTLKNFGRDRRYPIVNRFRDPGTPPPEPDRTSAQGRQWPRPARRYLVRRSRCLARIDGCCARQERRAERRGPCASCWVGRRSALPAPASWRRSALAAGFAAA